MSPTALNRYSLLACAAAVCLLSAPGSRPKYQESAAEQRLLPDATTWKYFPQDSVRGLMPYIAEFLNSSDEPSLLPGAAGPHTVSYRFEAWLMPGMNLRVIRFLLRPDGTATVVTFVVPYTEDPSAKVKVTKVERNVSAEDARAFLQQVESAQFWTMPIIPPPNPTPPKYYTIDGAFWVFEGVRNGAYHVVYRINPNASPFTDMVYCLGKDLAGLDKREIPRGMWPPLSLLPPNQSVAIQISGPVTAERPFALRVLNRRSKPISFCLACAGTIFSSSGWPVPAFDVQRPGPKKWSSVASGSDLGFCYAPTELGSEKTQEFRMKLAEPGRYRLRLYYVPRPLPNFSGVNVCSHLNVKGAKVVTSDEFVVLPDK